MVTAHPLGPHHFCHSDSDTNRIRIESFTRETIRACIAILYTVKEHTDENMATVLASEERPETLCKLAQQLLDNRHVPWPITVTTNRALWRYLDKLYRAAVHNTPQAVAENILHHRGLYVLQRLPTFDDPYASWNVDGLVLCEQLPLEQRRSGGTYQDPRLHHHRFTWRFRDVKSSLHWKIAMLEQRANPLWEREMGEELGMLEFYGFDGGYHTDTTNPYAEQPYDEQPYEGQP